MRSTSTLIIVLFQGAVIYGASIRKNCLSNAVTPDTQVNTTERLAALRALFATVPLSGGTNGIHAYIVPSEDAHKSEYTADHDKRRGFISGFSGSAGIAVVTKSKAALWTDGRYFLAAEEMLDCNWLFMKQGLSETPSVTEWLITELNTTNNAKVGASPKLLSSSTWKSYDKTLGSNGITLVAVNADLVDQVWNDAKWYRPGQPNSAIFVLDMKYAGKSWQDKIADVRVQMKKAKTQALVVNHLDQTAWLFNLRAADINYNPVFISFTIVELTSIRLYILSKSTKLKAPLQEHLSVGSNGNCKISSSMCAEVREYARFYTDVLMLGRDISIHKVWLSHNANYAIYQNLPTDKVYQANTPIALMKAIKNPVEIAGMISSHIRDSAALIKFLQKLEKGVKAGEKWTELSAADDLEKHRRAELHNMGLSFGSISASGPNGAVIHYDPTNATDRAITTDDVYLLDSGGQYLDGTTDVTRTMHFGTPTDYQKECYTRVLMGVINLAMLKWPENRLYGRDIDVMARAPIWNAGLRYRHGTGHGIGAFLSVHEGPARISYGYSKYEEKMHHGMFFSDEPGYYEDGKFGIRLETIIMVEKQETKYVYQNTSFLGFKGITMVPFEANFINYDMLTSYQMHWLNKYHDDCMKTVGAVLKADNKMEAYDWMVARTKPYERHVDINTSAGSKAAVCSAVILLTALILLWL